MELLLPAGSPEGLRAAVMNGADAVYFGLKNFGARRTAKNFTVSEAREAVSFCHARGVKAYITTNTLLFDRELPEFFALAREISSMGADAVLVQDLGVLSMLRECLPDLPLHASTQMTILNAEGAKKAAALGCTRAVAARELSGEDLRKLCADSPIEIEAFIHGAHCFCYSGQCYFSACIGGRSGNRGGCAQPCRLAYGYDKRDDAYPLSLKDMSLAGHLREMEEMGVKSLKIEGRLKRPEYAAITARIYSQALKNGREPTADELATLAAVFSRDGFTDGYFTGQKDDPDMLGRRTEAAKTVTDPLFAEARRSYAQGARDPQRIGVKFALMVRTGKPSLLAAEDDEGRRVVLEGAPAETAHTRPLSPAEATTQLYKTGGTPYRCDFARAKVEPGAALPLAEINSLRRTALERLTALRTDLPARRVSEPASITERPREPREPQLAMQARTLDQISDRLLEHPPERIYLPVGELMRSNDRTRDIIRATRVAAIPPRIVHPTEMRELIFALDDLRADGVGELLCGNIGLIDIARERGYRLRGDYGLNITNSRALELIAGEGFESATLSFELTFPQIRAISSPIPLELIAYGRLPLMITARKLGENGSSAHNLVDRTGARFPFIDAEGGRSEIFNSQKLWLADKQEDCESLGVDTLRLMLTTENPREAENALAAYRGEPDAQSLAQYTRGLYYRGVE